MEPVVAVEHGGERPLGGGGEFSLGRVHCGQRRHGLGRWQVGRVEAGVTGAFVEVEGDGGVEVRVDAGDVFARGADAVVGVAELGEEGEIGGGDVEGGGEGADGLHHGPAGNERGGEGGALEEGRVPDVEAAHAGGEEELLGGAVAAAAAAADVQAGVVGRGGEDEELLEGGANSVEVGVAAGPGDGGGAGSGDVGGLGGDALDGKVELDV